MIGMYGPIFFTTGVVVDNMKKTVGARWGTHEIWQGKPILEYAGASLIELSFQLQLLKPFTIDPLAAIITLQEIMDLATPLPLILGVFPMGRGLSLFVMESLEVEPLYFFQGGGILGANCEVKLKEYPDPGLINSLLAALGGQGSQSTADVGTAGSTTSAAGGVDTGADANAGTLPDANIADEQPPPTSFGPPDTPASPAPTPQVPQTGSLSIDGGDLDAPITRPGTAGEF
jgi:Phage P2 GpU